MSTTSSKPVIPSSRVVRTADARRLFLRAQGLSDDPAGQRRASSRAVGRLVERMGFVQVDTISTVERAHHLILAARMNGYRPELLASALEGDRALFEHWTHDASIIPMKWYPHWRPRFERYRSGTWHRKQLANGARQVIASVLNRIRREGPLSSRDFEHDGPKGQSSWWTWKPAKVALDYLWRCGVLHVVARRNFHKVYDLSERVVAGPLARVAPTEAEHVEWACRTAIERLGTATAREVAQFWAGISVKQAAAWLADASAAGEVTPVAVESADGSPPRQAFAPADYLARIDQLPEPPAGARLLSPFDPVLRDRARAKRLFNFDFRFEGFVPPAARKHGYYVMAILEGDRFVGRADPKFDRRSGTLRIGSVGWEPGVTLTRKRLAAFEEGVEALAGWVGAKSVSIER